MQKITRLHSTSAFLLAAFVVFSGCAKSTELGLPDEVTSEEELIEHDGTGEAPTDLHKLTNPDDLTASEEAQVFAKYSYVDPKRIVPTELLKKAITYYSANLSRIPNSRYLSVIDFSKKSTKARFFVIDMSNGSVWPVHTSHGRGSDPGHDGIAESFSNVPGSKKSSLGFYRTAETYQGKHGYSLRLDGLSSTNSNVRQRAIVIHSAAYVQEASVIQGRSEGCPAVSPALSRKLIDKVKGGSIIYAGLSGKT